MDTSDDPYPFVNTAYSGRLPFNYDNSFFSDTGSQAAPPPYTAPGPTNAYLKQVTLPAIGGVSNTTVKGYYYGSSQLALTTDPNGQTTYQHYQDLLNRPTKTFLPNDGWNQTTYASVTQRDFTGRLFETTNATSSLTLDSMGRPVQERLTSDPQGATINDRTYDTSGRVSTVSNPYRTQTDPTYGLTTHSYDALNRVKRVTLQDGNFRETFFGSGVGAAGGRTTQLCASGTYGLGYPTLTKDEAGKKRQVWVDSLGHLIEADEPDATGTLTIGTCYRYDVLSNLKQVDQGVQTRTISFDALSRLVTETTPEAGTVNYFYTDVGGALCSGNPKAFCRMTDARNITTAYTYDAENRLAGRTYSNGDPAVSYFYDQTSYNGLTITNGKGHRTGMGDGSGQTAWSYDSVGNVVAERRTVSGVTNTVSYTYNPDGSLNAVTYPSGLQTAISYDAAGRKNSVSCAPGTACAGNSFASSATYAPPGGLASVVLGNVSGGFAGITDTHTYNNRLQPINMQVTHTNGTVTVMDFAYSFVLGTINDGQVKSVTNNLATGRSQTYTYDEMNRLATAQSTATSGNDCWGQSYTYDRYANMPGIAVTKCSAPTLGLNINQNTNRITNTGFVYDAAGNLTNDGSGAFTWNAEGRMVSTAGVTYDYDGDGKRVKKSNGKLYWYGPSGEVLAESDLAGTIQYEYIYFGGQRIARRPVSGGAIHYYLSDRLGSARVMVDAAGAVVEESDFYPYGVERPIVDTLDNTYKFTGHERDSESGLDHTLHRQYASTTGRWLSPDPVSGTPANPQSWNAYTYGANSPCNNADPDGLTPCGSTWRAYYVGGILGGFTANPNATGPTLASLINANNDSGLLARVVFAESDSGAFNAPGSQGNRNEKKAVALSIMNRVDILNGNIQIRGVTNVATLGYGPAGASLTDVLNAPGQYASVSNGDINSGSRSNLNTGLGFDSNSAVCDNVIDSYFAGYYAVNHLLTGANDPFASVGVVTSFHHGTTPSPLESYFGTFTPGDNGNNFFGYLFINGQPTAIPRGRIPRPRPIPPGGPAQKF